MDKRIQNGRLVDPMDIDRQLTLSEIKQLLEKHKEFYESMNTFEFNIFDFTEAVGR